MRNSKWFAQKAGRRDGNHASIRDGLKALGHLVFDLAGTGGGVPDLCVYPRRAVDTQCLAIEDMDDGYLCCAGRQGHSGEHANIYGATMKRAHFRSAPTSLSPVWLEVKIAKGKLRESQLDWRASAEARGVIVRTARTLDEALEALR